MATAPPEFLYLYVIVLILVAVVPLYSRFRGSFHLGAVHRQVVDKLIKENKTQEAANFLRDFTGKESLNKNSTRVTLSIVLFTLLGLMTIHIMFYDLPEDNDVFRIVFAMVASLLSAVVGFYFGGKAGEKTIKQTLGPEALGPDSEKLLDQYLATVSDVGDLTSAARKINKKKQELTT